MRKTIFANGEYYHIYNRGVDKRSVFLNEKDYDRFLVCLQEFNRPDPIGSLYEKHIRDEKGSSTPMGVELPKLVEIIAYCLNSNHYHLILKQISEKGVEKFMHKVSTGYTNYFNRKCERSGALFQGRFKSIHVDSNEYLLYLSAYVNRNNFIHSYNSKGSSTPLGEEWKYCSAADYIGKRNGTLCNKSIILDQFKDGEYEEFLDKNAQHLKEKKDFARYCLE